MPLVLAVFVAGVATLQQQAALPGVDSIVVGIAAGALLAALAVRLLAGIGPSARPATLVLACLAAFLAGFSYAAAHAHWRLAAQLRFADEGRDLPVRGVIATLPTPVEGGIRFFFRIEGLPAGAPDIPRDVALSWHAPPEGVVPAQRWDLTLRLHRPQGAFNPGGFDAEAWMLEQGIRASGTVRAGAHDPAPVLVDATVLAFNPLVDRARAAVRERLRQLLGNGPAAGVVVALVVGDQSAISEEQWSLYNRTGISHLVSISGLHITMIAAAVALLAAGLWRRWAVLLRIATVPTVHAVAAIAGGYCYCLLAGWGVPAQRTLLMLTVAALAHCCRTRLSAARVLALAAAIVCLWDPWCVLASGFWLSFGAVACIFLAAGSGRGRARGWKENLREGARLQAAITVGQVPLTLAIFGQVSLVAPLANAVAIPVVSYLVAPAALAGAALAMLGEPLQGVAEFALRAAAQMLQWLEQFLRLVTLPSWSALWPPAAPGWTLVAAAAGCAWLLVPAAWPARWIGATWLLPLFVWPVTRPGPGELWVTALDVGQGMSVVLETAHATVVFDTGPRYSPDADAGARVLVPYLRSRGVGRIDLLVVSHQDVDHAGGAASLLQSIPVAQILTSVPAGHRLLAAGVAPPAGAPALTRCAAGQHLELDGLSLTVLAPPATRYEEPRASSNAHSCVVRAVAPAGRVLLTGDIPARQEREMIAASDGPLQAEVLVAPHHGSHSSSSEALIAAVRPRWVSMQVGYRNHFGHPHPEVLRRYRAQGVVVVRSDHSGAAQWRLAAGGGVALERWRLDHARYWHNQPIADRPEERPPEAEDPHE